MINDLIGVNELFDSKDFFRLLSRLLLNLAFATVVIQRYTKLYKNDSYRFTYFIFNIITFSLCFLLRKVPIELGFALGLFAVFGILRYRTEAIRIRDLTYLFIVIGIAILNAVSNKKVTLAELLLVNGAILVTTLLLEAKPMQKRQRHHEVIYDNLALLSSGDTDALHADLSERMGVRVERVSVRRFDLLRDTAVLDVFHREENA